jgi:16S rRNA processing protein RimM
VKANGTRGAVAVARITGCFGLRGHFKVRLMTRSADRLAGLKEVSLGSSPAENAPYRLEEVKVQGKNVLVKLEGVNDRSAAEPLVGSYLFIGEEGIAEPRQGSYYVHDIIGCKVFATDGTTVGDVADVYKLPAQDVWVVRRGDSLEMIPAVGEFIKEVDIEHRRIVIRLMEGLLSGS